MSFPYSIFRFAGTLSFVIFAGIYSLFAQTQSQRISNVLTAWEEALDAIYKPDPFDPEIPFLPEKKINPAIVTKRAEFKTRLRTVSKFKEKAHPEEIDKWFAKIIPSTNDPLALSINAKLRKEIKERIANYERAPARKVFIHPCARFFPGDVSESFRRIGKPFYPNPQAEGWQSTGLYAAPGERVKVRVSKSATGVGLRLRIGAHTEDLLNSRQRYWRRFPRITREFSVAEQSFEIASPFGGLIYVFAPKGRTSARTQFIFSGVVEAPFFVLGETKPKDWDYVRYAPGPWAEFVGKNFIATIPADEAAAIDNPEPIIRFWDETVAAIDKLTSGPKERFKPIRFVVDVETSKAAGSIERGNSAAPIIGTLPWSRGYWDMEQIRRDGSWELFFAIGKNAISDNWVFKGDRDTPAALLALYSMERTTGKKPSTFFDIPTLQAACIARIEREKTVEKNKKALRDKLKQEELEKKEEKIQIIKDSSFGKGRREREKAAEEADTEDTRADPGIPFQRLAAYIPIVEETGWEALAKTFKLYTVRNRLPLANDDEKQRTFVMLWSQSAKRNLSPFLENFDFARQTGASNYPEFRPKAFPPEANLRPEAGGTGFLGYSPFPTIAVLNENYRVPQLPKSAKKDATVTDSPFGEIVDDESEKDVIDDDFSEEAEEDFEIEEDITNDDAPLMETNENEPSKTLKTENWEPVFD